MGTVPGRQGGQGPHGTPSRQLWAIVEADGSLVAASGPGISVGGRASPGGSVVYVTGDNLVRCVFTASLGSRTAARQAGQIALQLGVEENLVRVNTYDSDGVAADRPFSIVISCP